MPAKLSTILYISEYREKTSSEFFIGTATGHTRLEENSDATQIFNITVFYPHDEEKPCYVPKKLEEGQVLSIANSKFTIGPNNLIDVKIKFIKLIFSKIHLLDPILTMVHMFFHIIYSSTYGPS